MRNLSILLLSLLVYTISYSQASNSFSKTEIILKFKSEIAFNQENFITNKISNIPDLDNLNNSLNVKKIKLLANKPELKTFILTFFSNKDIINIVELYKDLNLFEFVEPNYIGTAGGKKVEPTTIPNDTYFNRQWGLFNDGSFSSSATNDADIDMELAWDIDQGDSNIIIAVLDTGAKLDHPEFNGRIWQNTNESNSNTDSDNNGYIDDINGWDFAYNDNNPSDDNGHGTNVAGIIGANANNGTGYAGVDWNAKLMICKILDNTNTGYYSWWAEAIYYAVDNGAKVINMSVGGNSSSWALGDAVNYAHINNVTIVACMMNTNSNTIYYPAGYIRTIAVGSTDPNDERSAPFFWSTTSGSNYGMHIDVVAPGNHIYGLDYQSDTNYNNEWGGTSQAAPVVAGLCGLLLAQDNSRGPENIRTILRETAEDQVGNPTEDTAGYDNYYGSGRINAYQALIYNTASVKDINTNETITIYPNPAATNTILIKTNIPYNAIRINTILGEEIYMQKLTSNTFEKSVDISKFASGLYFVTLLNTTNNTSSTKKIIKL